MALSFMADEQTTHHHRSHTKDKPFNFNTIVGFVILGVLAWCGNTLRNVNDDIIKLKAVSELRDLVKADQLNRIESTVNHQQQQITDLQLDVVRLKPRPN